MQMPIAEKSFVATVHCSTPGHEGYWDCCELIDTGAGTGTRVLHKPIAWLTLTDSAHETGPTEFRFDYYQDASGNGGYTIMAARYLNGGSFNSLGVRFDLSFNHYVGLYPLTREAGALWQPLFADSMHDLGNVIEGAKIDNLLLVSPRQQIVRAFKRLQVGGHWFSYVNDDSGVPMILTLDILRVGARLLDDH